MLCAEFTDQITSSRSIFTDGLDIHDVSVVNCR